MICKLLTCSLLLSIHAVNGSPDIRIGGGSREITDFSGIEKHLEHLRTQIRVSHESCLE